MKEFMKTNTVTYNLMSFTGFKSMLIFSMLLDGPKTYEQIKNAMLENEYLHEALSKDTLRIYLNSLRKMGCKIDKTNVNRIPVYSLNKHPFELKVTNDQAKSILKIYKAISKSISVEDFISLQKFFEKISGYVADEKLKLELQNLSPLHNIDSQMVKDLIKYAKHKTAIKIYYNSANSGKKYIDILMDKIDISNGKLYIYGFNTEYQNYSGFLVQRIINIASVNINNPKLELPDIQVVYELKQNKNEIFEPLKSERIIETSESKIKVEIVSKNKFDIIQRIMSFSNKCKVVSPNNFKQEIIECLQKMKEGYYEK